MSKEQQRAKNKENGAKGEGGGTREEEGLGRNGGWTGRWRVTEGESGMRLRKRPITSENKRK